jgi:hypothetical protein
MVLFQFCATWCALCLALCLNGATGTVVWKEGGQRHSIVQTEALFGQIPYGKTLRGNLYHIGVGCFDNINDDLRSLMGGDFIVLADRGTCKFSR